MEFEIEFARDGDNSGLDKFHVHVHIHCFALALAWAVSTALLWPSPWRFVFPGLGGFAFLACVVGWLVLGRYALLEHAEEQLE